MYALEQSVASMLTTRSHGISLLGVFALSIWQMLASRQNAFCAMASSNVGVLSFPPLMTL